MTTVNRARKLVFLDFDGVLHPTSAPEEMLFCRVPHLQRALANHCCDLVISSSWRHHFSMGQLLAFLPRDLQSRVAGLTGQCHIGKWPRYQEIQNYLMANGNPSWRALDDALLEFPKSCPELLPCDPNVGFDTAQADDLGRWLAT